MILYTLVPNLSSSGLPLVLKDSLGIEGVPEAVAGEVQSERGEDCESWEERPLGRLEHVLPVEAEHRSPTRAGRVGAQVQELKGCLDQDGEGYHSVERAGQYVRYVQRGASGVVGLPSDVHPLECETTVGQEVDTFETLLVELNRQRCGLAGDLVGEEHHVKATSDRSGGNR